MLLELTADEARDLVHRITLATSRKLVSQGKGMSETFEGTVFISVPGKVLDVLEPEAA